MALVTIIIGKAALACEVPHTSAERYRGLSGRTGLAPGSGMVFVLRHHERAMMTMRGMRFSLDFIWVLNGKVTQVSERAPAGGVPPLDLQPAIPIDMVIEAPAGWAATNGITPGAPVSVSSIDVPVQSSSLDMLCRRYGPAR